MNGVSNSDSPSELLHNVEIEDKGAPKDRYDYSFINSPYRFRLIYVIFLSLGIGSLLPKNFFITAIPVKYLV